VVLAEHGDVRYDVHGGDVGGEDDDAGGLLLLLLWGGGGGGGGGGFAEGFDDFFYAAFEGFVFGGWGEKKGGVRILRVGWGGFGGRIPFLTLLRTFFPIFSSANGFANGTSAPRRGGAVFIFTSMVSSCLVATLPGFASSRVFRSLVVKSVSSASAVLSFFSFLSDLDL